MELFIVYIYSWGNGIGADGKVQEDGFESESESTSDEAEEEENVEVDEEDEESADEVRQ